MAIPAHMRAAAKPSSGPLIPSENYDDAIAEDLQLAFECLPVGDQAVWAVKRTWDLYDTAMATQLENRRSSYEPKKKRPQYKPFTQNEMVRRRLLLDSIRRIQIENEGCSRQTDPLYDIQTLSLEINLVNLHHNAFWAAVGMTRVLGTYSATQTIDLYEHLMAGRSGVVNKDNSAVCRIENSFSKVLRERFLDRLKLRAGSQKRLEKVEPTPAQVEALRYWLLRFFPTAPDPTLGFPATSTGSAYEGRNHMKTVESLLDMELFNAAADELGFSQLEGQLGIPLIATDLNNDPDNRPPGRQKNADAIAENVERVKQGLVKARRKRAQMRPQSVAVCVDDVYQGTLDGRQDACAFEIDETARIITFVAQDSAGQNLVLAAHVLEHDAVAEQVWEFFVLGLGKIVCELSYREDGVMASFLLTEKVSLWGRLTEAANLPVSLLSAMNRREEEYAVGQKLVTSSFAEQNDGNVVIYGRNGERSARPIVTDQMSRTSLLARKESLKSVIPFSVASTEPSKARGFAVALDRYLRSDEPSRIISERAGLQRKWSVVGNVLKIEATEESQPGISRRSFLREEVFQYAIFGNAGSGKTSVMLAILNRVRQLSNLVACIFVSIADGARMSSYRIGGLLGLWVWGRPFGRPNGDFLDYPFDCGLEMIWRDKDPGFSKTFERAGSFKVFFCASIADESRRLRHLENEEERLCTALLRSAIGQCIGLLSNKAPRSAQRLMPWRPFMLQTLESCKLKGEPGVSPGLEQHICRLPVYSAECEDARSAGYLLHESKEPNDFWLLKTREIISICGDAVRCYQQPASVHVAGFSYFQYSSEEKYEHVLWQSATKDFFEVPGPDDLEKKGLFPQQFSIRFIGETNASESRKALPRMKSVKALGSKSLHGWQEEVSGDVHRGRVLSLFPSTSMEDYGARPSGPLRSLFH